ncbi:MAG: DsbA family protein [Thermoanaerobaculia bacterium]
MKRLLGVLLALLAAGSPAEADPEARDRILKHFGGWYSFYPNSRISVRETDEVKIAGLEAYRVQRHAESERSREANVALLDRERDEVFVGRVLHDAERAAAKRAFDPLIDGPEIERHLSDAFGVPATLTVKGTRGALKEINVALRQIESAWVNMPGYVSEDGASILLGEFQSLKDGAEAFRRKLLADRPGVRLGRGAPMVVEFVDFQCERCRKRAPEVKKFVGEAGGSVEVRFFPLVKIHPWAFAAAESGAALAALSPQLYESYESALFARAESMSPEGARQLAEDVAEAAGRAKDFASEVSSGRPRERVLSDLRLGMRMGVVGTPWFFYEGTMVSAEQDLLETFVRERSGAVPAPKAPPRTQ